MVREELRSLATWEDRHRKLVARLGIVLFATLVLDTVGTVAIYFIERHTEGTEITSVGDAAFFTTVQLLSVSSSLRNPVEPAGRVVDVFFELWAVFVLAGVAGAVASFFVTADPGSSSTTTGSTTRA